MRILILCLSVLITSGSVAQAQEVYNSAGASNGVSRSSSSSQYMKTRKSGASGPISIKSMLANKSAGSSRSAYSSRSKASSPFSFDAATQNNGSIYSGLNSNQIRAEREAAAVKAQEYREKTAKERAERQARYAVQRGSVNDKTDDFKSRFGSQDEEEEEEVLYRKKAKKTVSPYLAKDKNDLKIPPRVFNSNY